MENYKEAIAKILVAYPDLTPSGFSNSDLPNDWTANERAFELSVDYLRFLPQVKTIGPYAPHSYGLKHDVEKLSDVRGKHEYVGQGVVIAALAHLGVPFRRDGRGANAALSKFARNKARTRLIDGVIPQISAAHRRSSARVKTEAMAALCRDLKLTCGEVSYVTPDYVDPCIVAKGDRLTGAAKTHCVERFQQLHERTGVPVALQFWNADGFEHIRLDVR